VGADDDRRERLRRAQEALTRALLEGAPPPPGFRAEDVRAAAESLASKRRHEAAHAWPALVAALGDRFAERFDAFARMTPLPARGGPLADGEAFARALAREAPLGDAVRWELLRVRLRWARRKEGLVPRRGWALVLGRLPQARCLVLGLRWPGGGERWLRLPYFAGGR
jgi:hypothetical protein